MTRQLSPSAERNRVPLQNVLLPRLSGRVLEVASGTGQHARWMTDASDSLVWQPSEADPDRFASIEAWREGASPRLLPPLQLDVQTRPWSVTQVDAVVAINLVHITSWAVTEALFAGAKECLASGGSLYLYGPFKVGGEHTAPSNQHFDAWLRQRSAEFGVRDLDELSDVAAGVCMVLDERIDMPANNFVVRYRLN